MRCKAGTRQTASVPNVREEGERPRGVPQSVQSYGKQVASTKMEIDHVLPRVEPYIVAPVFVSYSQSMDARRTQLIEWAQEGLDNGEGKAGSR